METLRASVLMNGNYRYVSEVYQCYQSLLDGSASQEVDAFLNEQILSTYGKV